MLLINSMKLYVIAKALIKDNTKVIATARRTNRLTQLQSASIDFIIGDLNSTGFQDSIESYIFDTYGKRDYLFNCAGTIENGTIEEMDIEKMTLMIRLKIESTFRLIYKFLKSSVMSLIFRACWGLK
jgi:short-subunit dehydrogenase